MSNSIREKFLLLPRQKSFSTKPLSIRQPPVCCFSSSHVSCVLLYYTQKPMFCLDAKQLKNYLKAAKHYLFTLLCFFLKYLQIKTSEPACILHASCTVLKNGQTFRSVQ